jgi:hypothetical protein
MSTTSESRRAGLQPLVGSVAMGYGHLRAAAALAERFGQRVSRLDEAPFANARERAVWRRSRWLYECASRASRMAVVGRPVRAALDRATAVAADGRGDPTSPSLPVRYLARLVAKGFGETLVDRLGARDQALLTTFYAPAIACDALSSIPVWCVVTDTDVNRVWVPHARASSRIVYLAPTQRTVDRLVSYGVAPRRCHVTGFPLPHELVGGATMSVLKSNLARRLGRLGARTDGAVLPQPGVTNLLGARIEPRPDDPLHLVFAVGGAGTHVETGCRLLDELAPWLAAGRLRLTLAAGTRIDVAARFSRKLRAAELPRPAVEIVCHQSFAAYYAAFNRVLADADLLWTKPSELVFYAALGIPMLLDEPVGDHERANRDWIVDNKAGFHRIPSDGFLPWLQDRLTDGSLATAAWSGFARLEACGTYAIIDLVVGRGAVTADSIRVRRSTSLTS